MDFSVFLIVYSSKMVFRIHFGHILEHFSAPVILKLILKFSKNREFKRLIQQHLMLDSRQFGRFHLPILKNRFWWKFLFSEIYLWKNEPGLRKQPPKKWVFFVFLKTNWRFKAEKNWNNDFICSTFRWFWTVQKTLWAFSYENLDNISIFWRWRVREISWKSMDLKRHCYQLFWAPIWHLFYRKDKAMSFLRDWCRGGQNSFHIYKKNEQS